MSPQQGRVLTKSFFNELEQEWPTELSELTLEKVGRATLEQVGGNVKRAYLVGYMAGKGWTSMEEMTEVNLLLGDELAALIRSTLKGAKSRGAGFASAFVCIAAEGTKAALGGDTRAYEPSKYEILNEILLREGTNIIGKSIKHPELLGQSTLSVNVNPFNPSDSEYLTSAFLGGPSHMGHFDTERLETILRKLLQDDYERYYESAKQRILASH